VAYLHFSVINSDFQNYFVRLVYSGLFDLDLRANWCLENWNYKDRCRNENYRFTDIHNVIPVSSKKKLSIL
jgi:hypothetical protein